MFERARALQTVPLGHSALESIKGGGDNLDLISLDSIRINSTRESSLGSVLDLDSLIQGRVNQDADQRFPDVDWSDLISLGEFNRKGKRFP